MKISFFILLFVIFVSDLSGQANIRDSVISTPVFTAHYSFQLPGGDLAKRFGSNSNIGGGFFLKNKHNWIFETEYNFLFSGNVKEDTMLYSISTKDEHKIIDGNGIYADVNMYERGFYIALKLGKIIKSFGPNPNSGIIFSIGSGILQHKIRIENADNTAPQLTKEYVKGYDRLTNGLGISEYIGYIYFGNNRLVSFNIGFEFTQAFTQSRRLWDFDRMSADKTKRLDLLYGIKITWMIPLYSKASNDGFYYF